jgi:general secretion pathway protein K
MRARRGAALLAVLWLVVAIAAVSLQFSIDAHERRRLGTLASERGQQRAAALGALALAQARLEQAVRVGPSNTTGAAAILASSDPWHDIDSLYSTTVLVDSMEVQVEGHDLGEKLNINRMSEQQLQTFFSFLLQDFSKSQELAQAIMDWRDADSIPRPSGAERDAYIKAGNLALPTNGPFRDITELADVMGMTPEIFAAARPYLTTLGTAQVNLNSAPVPVLRVLPGMTDATLARILQLRSQGRRISSVSEIFGALGRTGRPLPGQLNSPAAIAQIQAAATTTTQQIEFTFTARTGAQASPTKLTAVVARQGNNAVVRTKSW